MIGVDREVRYLNARCAFCACIEHYVTAADERRSIAVHKIVWHKAGQLQGSMANSAAMDLPVLLHGKTAVDRRRVSELEHRVILAFGLKCPAGNADNQIFRRDVTLRAPGWVFAFRDASQDGVKFLRRGAIQGILGAGAGLRAAVRRRTDEDAGKVCRRRSHRAVVRDHLWRRQRLAGRQGQNQNQNQSGRQNEGGKLHTRFLAKLRTRTQCQGPRRSRPSATQEATISAMAVPPDLIAGSEGLYMPE